VVDAEVRVVSPAWLIEKRGTPVDEETMNGLVPAVPVREKVDDGVDDPIPILPLEPKLNMRAPVDEAIASGYEVEAFPVILTLAIGVDDPTPNLPLEPKTNMRAPVEDAIANGYWVVEVPRIARVAIGVVVPPIPTLPLLRTVRIVAPVEDAIANGLTPDAPCTLKVTVDEVALIPATVPLSRSVEVPRVVVVSQRVAKPRAPPVRDEVIPSVDVATHLVVVPVVWSTIPRVPVALAESRRNPASERFVVVALVVEALVAMRLVAVALVILPLVAKRVLIVPTVVDEVLNTESPVTVRAEAVALARVV